MDPCINQLKNAARALRRIDSKILSDTKNILEIEPIVVRRSDMMFSVAIFAVSQNLEPGRRMNA